MFYISNEGILFVSHTKYLGVLVDKRLTWSNHIDHITSKANKALGFLQQNIISCPMQVKINCYNTFVWPILDYYSTTVRQEILTEEKFDESTLLHH